MELPGLLECVSQSMQVFNGQVKVTSAVPRQSQRAGMKREPLTYSCITAVH